MWTQIILVPLPEICETLPVSTEQDNLVANHRHLVFSENRLSCHKASKTSQGRQTKLETAAGNWESLTYSWDCDHVQSQKPVE